MAIKEIDGMPVLEPGDRYLLDCVDLYVRSVPNWYPKDQPYPTWRDCSHDEAMEALADGQEVQAWYTSGGYYRNVETRGVNLVWADCDTTEGLLYATTTRKWRVKQ